MVAFSVLQYSLPDGNNGLSEGLAVEIPSSSRRFPNLRAVSSFLDNCGHSIVAHLLVSIELPDEYLSLGNVSDSHVNLLRIRATPSLLGLTEIFVVRSMDPHQTDDTDVFRFAIVGDNGADMHVEVAHGFDFAGEVTWWAERANPPHVFGFIRIEAYHDTLPATVQSAIALVDSGEPESLETLVEVSILEIILLLRMI